MTTNTSFYGNVAVITVYCYKDEGGILKFYGGGAMSDMINYYGAGNNYRFCSASGIGGYTSVPASGPTYATTNSFKIFPDGQGGCGVVMVEAPSIEKNFPAFDQLCRVKKDSYVQTKQDGIRFYKKDSVVQLYSADVRNVQVDCYDGPPCPTGQNCTFITNIYTVSSQGVKNLLAAKGGDVNLYDPVYIGSGKYNDAYTNYAIEKINAAMLPTDGNINALLITWNQRNYANSQVTNWSTRGVVLSMEKYDSLPFQLCSGAVRPAGMNKINEGKSDLDTLIAPTEASYFYDYSLTGSGNKAFAITSVNGLSGGSGPSPFYYQEAKVIRQNADSFALKINTVSGSDTGTVIGIGTGYDRFPYFAGDGAGNATFYYAGPDGRDYVKASPVGEGGKMRWGSLGLPLNSGGVSGSYYYPSSPFLYMDAEGNGVIAWEDGRKTPDGYTGENIYTRHLDSLLKPNYQPPLLKAQVTVDLNNPIFSSSVIHPAQSIPQSLVGSSNAWTVFSEEVYGAQSGSASATPVAAVKDDYNLGTVTVSTYEVYNNYSGRQTDGKPYLDRNYTISVTNHPAGASIHVRLIFTEAEFDSLKAHDATIQDPGDLAVIKQPSTGTAPATYTASSKDKGIKPIAWGTIENTDDNITEISGYYIEIVISDFSNFFISSAQAVLPVTLQSFTVKAVTNTALLQWQTASEINNSHFDIERSATGKVFTKIGRVQGHGNTSITQYYQFTDAAPLTGNNFYRLAQVDLDGKTTYSEVRLLLFNGQAATLKVFPNPVKSALHIQLPQAASGQDALQFYNVKGKKVLMQAVSAGTLQTDVDLSTLASGLYILRYGTESMKVVKQ